MNRPIKVERSIHSYMKWPVNILFLVLLWDVCLYAAEPKVLPIGLVFTAVYVLIMVALLWYKNRRIARNLADYAMQYNQVQRRMLQDLRVPYAMLDRTGLVLWANDEFARITHMYGKTYCSVKELFADVDDNLLNSMEEEDEREFFVEKDENKYRAVLKCLALEEQEEGEAPGNGEVLALYLYDETKIRTLEKESDERRMVVGLIYIDNFEEALDGISEVNSSLLPALVERKINQYMRNLDAIVKKTDKDKFLVVFQAKYLYTLRADNFRILEDVRSVHIGNTVNITISIGIGVCDEENYSFLHAFESAKLAISRALERGGDQVVVRGDKNASANDADGNSFYGGKTDSVQPNSKVRSRVMAEALCDLIRGSDNVLIMGHTNGDADSLGASIGMYRIAHQFSNDVHIVMNEVSKTVRMIFDLYAKSPGYDEAMFITSQEAVKRAGKGTLLIVVDVNNEARTECPDLISLVGNIFVVDHHREKQPITGATLSYAGSYASSASEMVAEMVQCIEGTGNHKAEGNLVTPADADAMYAGIMLDTNNFITKTGVRTFEAAVYLKRKGADITRVRQCFRKDKASFFEKARIIDSAEVFRDIYGFAVNDCSATDETPTEFGAQIANELLEVMGIQASFVFTLYNGVVYVSARSTSEVNVELIMNRCGGGGHMNMAGAQYPDCSIEDAEQKIKNVIEEMTEKGEI